MFLRTPLRNLRTLAVELHWCALVALYGWMAFKAFAQFKPTSDFLLYHLPHALRLFGLAGWTPDDRIAKVAAGFPWLGELVEGTLVWMTGRLSAANGVGVVGFTALLAAIAAVHGARFPFRWFLTFCLAVPLLILHAWIGYVDLFAGCMLATAFVGFSGVVLLRRPSLSASIAIAGIAAAMLVKYQAWPPAFVLGCAMIFFVDRLLRGSAHRPLKATLFLCALLAALCAYPLRNLALFGNPTYPYPVPLLRLNLPAPASTSYTQDTPPYLRDSAPIVQFFHSVYELNRLQPSEQPYRWTYDEYHGNNSPHQRVGGWFFLTTATLTLLLALGALRRFIPPWLAATFLLMILSVAFVPHYHELRYSLFIPLTALFLFSAFLDRYPLLLRRIGIAALSVCALYVLFTLKDTITYIDLSPPSAFSQQLTKNGIALPEWQL